MGEKNSSYIIEQRFRDSQPPPCCVDCFDGEGLAGLVEAAGVAAEEFG